MRAPKWLAQSFNFTGLRLDPSSPITLGDYFQPSPAHAGQKIMALSANGRWEEAAAGTMAQPGTALGLFDGRR